MTPSHPSQQRPPAHSGLSAAEMHLFNADQVMATLIRTHGPCLIAARERAPFETLVTSIVSQQLSAKAAATIKQRLATVVPGFTPWGFLAASPESLRGAGLSSSKVRYILELSRQSSDKRLDFDFLSRRTDDEVIATLTALPGIGRWTAEMFLIFSLHRPDVLSLNDAGLRRAVRLLYGEETQLHEVATPWRPHASTASWYLWRHLDT